MGLFRKKTDSIQQKIDMLKKKQPKSGGFEEEPSLPPTVIPDISPEEQAYLDTLEKSLHEGQSILSTPLSAKNNPAGKSAYSVPMPAVKLKEEPQDEGEKDPFFSAEREIEALVSQGQKQLESSLRSRFQNREQEAEAETQLAEPKPGETRPEDTASDETERRKAEVESSYDMQGNLPFPPGTLVRLNDDSLGIIKEEIPNREYDLVYILTADGRVEPRGICLFAVGIERLGRLPYEQLKKIEKRMMWERDHLIYYLDNVADASKIPHAQSSAKPAENGRPKIDDGKSLQRGRCITITFGTKKWDAIFWSEDATGSIVAHNQSGEWELLHMDLKRFGSALKPGKLLQGRELREIEESVISRHAG